MKSVRGYLRVCLQSYELQSRIDPTVAMETTTMQGRRKKSNPAGRMKSTKKWRKNRRERKLVVIRKADVRLTHCNLGNKMERGCFHPLREKIEGVRGKEAFPSRKSLDSEIGLFLRWMLEFLVMILL